jgi:ribonuclease R
VIGLISAGAFVAFGEGTEAVYEGMLPVRYMRRLSADRGARGEWWQLNDLGTILRGERSGASLRLGDPIEVQVSRVDALRGRVDLIPPGEPQAGG